MGESLERVVPGGRDFTTIRDTWTELVGEGLAGHTSPTSRHGTTLVVAVDDPAWAPQVRYLEADLLTRIATTIGAGRITEITVVVRPG